MKSQKFLIIKPSSLGDIIHTLPIVAAIKDKYPKSYIVWVVTRGFEKILDKNPCIDDTFIFERERWGGIKNFFCHLGEIFCFFRKIRKSKFDYVLDFQGLLRTAIISWASGSSQRIGFANAKELAPLSYTRRVSIPNDRPIHAIDRYKRLLEEINIKDFPISYPLQISQEQRQIGEDLPQGIKIAIIPGARWETKMWPTEHFAKLINILTKEHQAVSVLLGGPNDVLLAEKIKAGIENKDLLVDLVGKTRIKELAAVLQKMTVVVGNDTGPMHLAVAMGVPVLGLFGPTDPKKVGPYGKENQYIWKDLCHARCKKRYCAYEKGERRCLHSIIPEEVVKKLKNMGLE